MRTAQSRPPLAPALGPTAMRACLAGGSARRVPRRRYEWPGPAQQFEWLHAWLETHAPFCKRFIGRGVTLLFLGALAASNFPSQSRSAVLGAASSTFGTMQMAVGVGYAPTWHALSPPPLPG